MKSPSRFGRQPNVSNILPTYSLLTGHLDWEENARLIRLYDWETKKRAKDT